MILKYCKKTGVYFLVETDIILPLYGSDNANAHDVC